MKILATVRLIETPNQRYEYEATNPKQPPSAKASFLLFARLPIIRAIIPHGTDTSGVPCAKNRALIKPTTKATRITTTALRLFTTSSDLILKGSIQELY